MPLHCCAPGCTNTAGKAAGVSFYRFPADTERRSKWIAAVKRDSWQPTKYTRLCSVHFISGTLCPYEYDVVTK